MAIVHFYNDTKEILVGNTVWSLNKQDIVNFDFVQELLQDNSIMGLINSIYVSEHAPTTYDKISYMNDYVECIKKFIKEDEQKQLLSNLKTNTWENDILVPLKAYVLLEIRWGFLHKLDTFGYCKSFKEECSDDAFRTEYMKRVKKQADIYTKLYCRSNMEWHYYLSDELYSKAKETFWALENLSIYDAILKQWELKKLGTFLDNVRAIYNWDKKVLNLLWIHTKKDDVEINETEWEWTSTWLDMSILLLLFTDIIPLIYIRRNFEDDGIWLLYDVYDIDNLSFNEEILQSGFDGIIINPFIEFRNFIKNGGEKREWVIEEIKAKYKDYFYWNETLDETLFKQLTKDIRRCLEIWANQLVIKINNHNPTEMQHKFSLSKAQACNYEKYKEYALMEWGGIWHIWPTWWKWVKLAFDWRKNYSYKKKKKSWK